MKKNIIRAVAEILSIMLLFYTNLLMGQYLNNSSNANDQSLLKNIINIITPQNIVIGIIGATLGFIIVELANKK
jgi:hypothetical protein